MQVVGDSAWHGAFLTRRFAIMSNDSGGRVSLRAATVHDAPLLHQWDLDPDVIGATTSEPDAHVAFGGLDWHEELRAQSPVSYYLIAEADGRAIGAMQVCDPREEPTHYWGDVRPNLRAVDIWIGAPGDRGRGFGAHMMRLAHTNCFADAAVDAIVIDPLVTNTRALRFYERLGYRRLHERMFGDDRCLVMQLTREQFLHDGAGADLRPCVFCEIVAGRVAATRVAASARSIAIVDLRQAHPGHVIVMPRAHLHDLRDADDATIADLMQLTARITRVVGAVMPNDGLSIWHSIGAGGHQEVPHLHVHVHPRVAGDDMLRVYAATPPTPPRATLEAIGVQLRAALELPE